MIIEEVGGLVLGVLGFGFIGFRVSGCLNITSMLALALFFGLPARTFILYMA